MNCQRFQSLIEEYCEGTLSPGTQTAAEEHLARCSACRSAVQAEQVLVQSLSGLLQQSAVSQTLRPVVKRRMVRELERESSRATGWVLLAGWWQRLGWVGAGAACLVVAALLAGRHFSKRENPLEQTVHVQSGSRHIPVSIQVSRPVPTYTFKREGNRVTDTLASGPSVVDVALWRPNTGNSL